MNKDRTDWFRSNADRFSGKLLFEEPLSRHTYYRIGGPAQVLVSPENLADLSWVAEGLRESELPLFILGQGSNVLAADAGYRGVVLRMNHANLEVGKGTEANVIRTGASVSVTTLLRHCGNEGWGGLELLAGIPGLVGGVVRMNGGTHLGEAKDRLARVEVFTFGGGLEVIEGAALRFGYRSNYFLKPRQVVWAAEWRITPRPSDEVKKALAEVLGRRKATQPLEYPSCGSVFKNPGHSHSAWKVIDQLGLRGHRIGNAQFAEKHSNFIINLRGAKASDVKALIDLAKRRAKSELGIVLEPEVITLGFPGDTSLEG